MYNLWNRNADCMYIIYHSLLVLTFYQFEWSVEILLYIPFTFLTPYTVTVLNISSAYTEKQVRQCYKFWFYHQL